MSNNLLNKTEMMKDISINPIEEVLSKIQAFNQYVQYLHSSISDLQLENARLEAEKEMLKDYKDCSKELEAKNNELGNKTAECDFFHNKCDLILQEITVLQNKLNDEYRKSSELEIKLKNTEDKKKELWENVGNKTKEIEDKDTALENLKNEYNNLNDEKKRDEEDLNNLRNKYTELEGKYNIEEQCRKTLEGSVVSIYNSLIDSLAECIDVAKKQIDNDALKNYLSGIKIKTVESYESMLNCIKEIVLHENSTLCRLLTIRLWHKQSETKSILSEKYDFTTLVMLTEKIVDIVKPFGYEIKMIDNFSIDGIVPTGYNSAKDYAKVAPKVFSDFCKQQEKPLYCEYRELSFTKTNGEDFKGSLYYVEGTKK